MRTTSIYSLLAACSLAVLTGCGGNSLPAESSDQPNAVSSAEAPALTDAMTGGSSRSSRDVAPAMTVQAASRFLHQATMGPNMASITALSQSGPSAWLDAQFAKPQTIHRHRLNYLATLQPGVALDDYNLLESFWGQAAKGDDQLRQRIAFSLSQIFVISTNEGRVGRYPLGMASYFDMLGANAFGNFRTLLDGVALHPMMGLYLSHLRNQKESGNRLPDENFAREVMQLFTIGLHELNADGTLKLSNNAPIDTYNHDDIMGLAKVFTGWSWSGPDQAPSRFYGSTFTPGAEWTPMQNYPLFHSTSEKRFLGVTLAGNGSGADEVKQALDRLFNHPNVGPFIGRQLIQRLVTSNPSPAYVGRVAAAFNNNGSNVRGDMRAVIRAILLDPEARATPSTASNTAHRLREPTLRLANWMRAFEADSVSRRFLIRRQDDAFLGLAQTPWRAPSVFNFYRPSFSPPGTSIAANNMVAPEMQVTDEAEVTGYLISMQDIVKHGVGSNFDVHSFYLPEVALARTPDALLDRVNLLLLAGQMSPTLRSQILAAINSVAIPVHTDANTVLFDAALRNRVYLAVYLTLVSPEYLVQK